MAPKTLVVLVFPALIVPIMHSDRITVAKMVVTEDRVQEKIV